ncbi:MAG: ROK family protein [Acidimicrobiia bacterium]|nr:ROK family protein [Acidimicrobiia bacterium]
MTDALYGAIEAGGTKFRIAVGTSPDLIADTTIPTTTPDETIGASIEFLEHYAGQLKAVGIASFGPLDLDPSSATYGSIIRTPKPGWTGTPFRELMSDALGVPVAIDVDVGGAAIGEWTWGAARGLDTFIYMTVGTGVGGGIFAGGRIHHGMGHPELGHIAVAREPDDDFAGHCPFHGACFEGMAAGPAISARWGERVTDLVDRPEVWDLEARYIAQALRTLTYVVAPQRIIVGGGVNRNEGLLGLVRDKLSDQLAGYGTNPVVDSDLTDYVVSPEFGQDAGLVGAIALAAGLDH